MKKDEKGPPKTAYGTLSADPKGSPTQLRPHALDRWLQKEQSVPLLANSINRYFGYNENEMAQIVKKRMQHDHAVKYRSVKRSKEDSAVWYSRRNSIISQQKKKHSRAQNEEEIAYDPAVVKRIDQIQKVTMSAIVVCIGVSMAIAGMSVSKTADYLLDKKIEYALEVMDGPGGDRVGFLSYLCISILFSLGAFMPIAYRPIAAGSGIAEAKSTLNGIVVPDCTSLLTGLCKAVSVIFSVAASLPAGLEGPMIHLGLVLGANANRIIPRNIRILDPLRTERYYIDFAAIGTAAGVTTAFHSPIGGILFVMEEGCSFWSQKLTWRCFAAACVAIITIHGVSSALAQEGDDVTPIAMFGGIGEYGNSLNTPHFDFREYGYFALVGALGGLTGSFFCVINRELAKLRRDLSLVQKGIQVVLVTSLVVCITWFLSSYMSVCHEATRATMIEGKHLRQFNCPDGYYNELATLLLNPLGSVGINLLFHEDNDFFSAQSCLIAGSTHFLLLIIVFGTTISAGIFIPLMFSGACLGRAFAIAMNLDARTYAIVGAAACLGGVARVLISLTAIIAHTTSLSYFTTPIMVATLLSRVVGNVASGYPGIYDIIMHLRGIPFLEEDPPEGAKHMNLRARNIMNTEFATVPSQVKVSDLLLILKKHPGADDFPVVNPLEDGSLLGSIDRTTLLALLIRREIFQEQNFNLQQSVISNELVEEKILSYKELDDARINSSSTALEAIERNCVKASDMEKVLYVSPYTDIAPHTFDGHGSVERAYEKFRMLGLRTMLVLSHSGCPIGVITRRELHLVEEMGEDEQMVKRKKSIVTENNDLG